MFSLLDSALSLDETTEEILDEDAVLGVNKNINLIYYLIFIIKLILKNIFA